MKRMFVVIIYLLIYLFYILDCCFTPYFDRGDQYIRVKGNRAVPKGKLGPSDGCYETFPFPVALSSFSVCQLSFTIKYSYLDCIMSFKAFTT